ncbi:MAG: amino acid adenylation domain-containing protein, partial [Polyangiaceae bacterium]
MRNEIASIPLRETEATLDVALRVREIGSEIELSAVWDASLFTEARMIELLAQLERFIEQAVRAPDANVFAHSIVTREARGIIPDPSAPLAEPRYETVREAIDRHAATAPDRVAIVHGETRWTYAELRDRSLAIAASLEFAGVRARDRVAIAGRGCPGVVAAILGTWRRDAVIVGLSDNFPLERRRLMAHLASARVCVVVGDGPSPVELPSLRVDPTSGAVREPAPRLDAETVSKDLEGDPAYVIFTSGTTGVPKGVLGRTNSLAHFVSWQRDEFGLGPGDRGSQLHNISFDPVQRDMFTVLASGGTLFFPPATVEEIEPAALLAWLRDSSITMLHHVPSMIDSWLERWPKEATVPTMRFLFIAGEPLTDALVRRCRTHFPNARIVNLYGPAETTMAKFFYEVPAELRPGTQRVGRPLPHGQALLVGEGGALCGVGEPGEIVIRTPFRTLGYIGGDERRRFRQNPFANVPGDVVYFSGDRGRYALDGELEILGRVDDQIKVRGVRIEPAEIAATLETHPALARAFVSAFKDDASQNALCAYVVRNEGASVEADELRRFLADRVLYAMIPSAFAFLDAMPLTLNGKVDRKALPAPQIVAASAPYVAPRNEIEEAVAGAFAEVLGRPRVGVHDDFFAIGGQSLSAVRLVARLRQMLGATLTVRSLFDAPTVAGLAAVVAPTAVADAPIERLPRHGTLPVSSAEARLWFLDQLEPGRASYNLPLGFRARGPLNHAALVAALADLVSRHEALRTRYVERNGVPEHVIDSPTPIPIAMIDVASEVDLADALLHESARPFDLAAGPLLRVALFRVTEVDHFLLFTMHHIISDGWSNDVLARELWTLYRARCDGEAAALPEPAIQYADYAGWERAALSGHALERQIAYWRNALEGLPLLELPTDVPRSADRDARGSTYSIELDAALVERLEQLGRREGATLFMILLAAFEVLLTRSSGQRDFGVGIPVAHRTRVELEDTVGFFVNTLVIRADVGGDPSVRELVGRVREAVLGAQANEDVPFERLVEELAPGRGRARVPLFDVMFSLDVASPDPSVPGMRVERYEVEISETKLDLALACTKRGDGTVRCIFEYATASFRRETIERFARRYWTIASALPASADERVAEIAVIDDSERRALLGGASATIPRPITDVCAHELVRRWARETPDAVALVDGERRVTYAELEARAGGVASRLRSLGVRPGDIVAVSATRRIETFFGIVGALQAGAAYAPIDPALPEERRARMLDRCGVTVTLGYGDIAGKAEIRLDRLQDHDGSARSAPRPDWPMVVLHTSGTTGEPKGVLLAHRGLVEYAQTMSSAWGIAREDRVLQFAALSFDACLEEILLAWTTGASLVLRDESMLEPDALLDACGRHHVTVLDLPTAYFGLVVAAAEKRGWPPSVRRIVIGGDRIDATLLDRFHQTRTPPRLASTYGPTEASISVTSFEATRDAVLAAAPLGAPVAGCRAYVLDERLALVPLGAPGEICIAGAALAHGYVADPVLTSARFMPNPFGPPGSRLYKTGDLVRWRADGTLEFLGRRDQQVKIRGFRIELGEIEAALLEHASVREAVVVATGSDADKRLVAYVAPLGASDEELASHLKTKLPPYMVPAAFVKLDKLPLTPHGKVDRKKLPAPVFEARGEFIAPRNEMERALAAIWREVLEVERVGIDDDF